MVSNPSKKNGFFATLMGSRRRASAESVRSDLLHSLHDACFDESGCAVVDHDGRRYLAFGLMFRPVHMASDYTELHARIALEKLPVGSVVQSCVLSTPQVTCLLDAWRETRGKFESDVGVRLTRARYDMLAADTETSDAKSGGVQPRQRMHYLFVQVPIPAATAGNEAAEHAWLVHGRQLCRETRDLWSAAGLQNELMSRADHADLWAELLNMQMSPRGRMQHSAGPGAQGTPSVGLMEGSKVGLDERGRLVLGGSGKAMTLAILTVDRVDFARQCVMEHLLGHPFKDNEFIKCPYWAYTTIQIADTSTARDAVKQRHHRLRASRAARTSQNDAALAAAEAFLLQHDEGRCAARAYTGINVYADADEVVRVVEETRARAAMAGMRLSEETLIVGPTFVASLPFQYTPAMDPPNGGLRRAQLMTSLNAASLMFVQGTGALHGANRGGVPLLSRDGNLAAFDPWSRPGSRRSHSFSVFGAAGSGKTVFALEVLTDTLARGGHAAILEQGGSYSRHVAALGGATMTFDPEAPFSVNPFSRVSDEDDLYELLPALKDFIFNLAFGGGSLEPGCVSARYRALAEHAAHEAFREAGSAASLETVIRQLMSRDDDDAQEMARRLARFTDAGYRRWFDGPSELAPLERLTSYQFERLSGNDTLRQAVLGALLVHLRAEMYQRKNRTARKLVLVDDAEALLRGVPGESMTMAVRRARPFNGGYGVIAQVPPPACPPELFAFHILTRAHRAAIDRLLEDGFLDNGDKHLAHSLRAGLFIKDEFGEAGVYHLALDELSQIALSTLAADAQRLRTAQEEGLSYVEALARCAGAERVLPSWPWKA